MKIISKRYRCAIALMLPLMFSLASIGQNLVPNPSFEQYSACPIGPGEINNVLFWATPDSASPDYYNSCYSPIFPLPFLPNMGVPENIQGYQAARTGDGYAGIISHDQTLGINTNYREYLKVQLSQPLAAGEEYCVEFYWTLADKSVYYVGEIGAYFTPNNVFLPITTALPFTPQVSMSNVPMNDTTNWVLFQSSFVANGGEQYMIIGNFNNPANTNSDTTGVTGNLFQTAGSFAYYYIEDVFVGTECITCTIDIALETEVDCDDLSMVTVTASAEDLTPDAIFQWSNGENSVSIVVAPGENYSVTVTDGACQGNASIELAAIVPTSVSINATDTICAGEVVVIAATGGERYVWSTADTTSSISVAPETTSTYSVIATGDGGCQDTAEVTVVVFPVPTIELLTLDTAVCINSKLLLLEATPASGVFFGPGVDTGFFNASVAEVGVHWIYFSAGEFQCSAIDSLQITVEPDSCLLIFPNVISLGTDHVGESDFCGMVHQNNVFQLPCLELYPGNKVTIFDRWGRKRHEATNYHLDPWDGNDGTMGVYYWVLELPDTETIHQGFFHIVQ